MTWTTDVPAVPGYYWLRWAGAEPRVVYVAREGRAWHAWDTGDDRSSPVKVYRGAEWCGPLVAPV